MTSSVEQPMSISDDLGAAAKKYGELAADILTFAKSTGGREESLEVIAGAALKARFEGAQPWLYSAVLRGQETVPAAGLRKTPLLVASLALADRDDSLSRLQGLLPRQLFAGHAPDFFAAYNVRRKLAGAVSSAAAERGWADVLQLASGEVPSGYELVERQTKFVVPGGVPRQVRTTATRQLHHRR